jgi:monovalent cation/hydrogen antiporter
VILTPVPSGAFSPVENAWVTCPRPAPAFGLNRGSEVITHLEMILGLLAVVAGLGVLARKVQVPHSIVLVLAGLALGWIPGIPQVGLSPELFLLILLPPLIYPSAVSLPWREFRANFRPISLLAVGLVLATMLGIGFIAHGGISELPLGSALVLGAIVSPTDPIAATAIAQRMKVPRRIERVLESESLVNDSTGLVVYQLSVAAVVTGSFSYGHATLECLKMAGGGMAWGLVTGWVVVQIQKRIDDPPIETTISLLTPFAAYLVADQLHFSGVLAVVATGLYVGWNSPLMHTAQTRLQAAPFWRMVQFMLNGVVFLLVGLQLPDIVQGMRTTSVFRVAWEAALISAAVIVIRLLWVFPVAYVPRWLFAGLPRHDPFPDWRHVALVAWTGMRGPVSLAAALGLPQLTQHGEPFPARDSIQFLTYAVILATLVVQGLTLPRVIGWLKISGADETEREEHEARLKTGQAVLQHLEQLKGKEPARVLEKLQAEYTERVHQVESSADQNGEDESTTEAAAHCRLQGEALQIQRQTLLDLRNRHVINDEVLRRIQHELDLAEDRLHHH